MADERLTMRIIQPGEGATWDIGSRVTCKVGGTAYTVLELALPPGAGSPLHIHRREDEIFTLLEGECEFTADGRAVTVKAGGVVVLLRGLPHAFRNPGPTPTRALILAVPGGLDGFCEEISALLAAGVEDPARFDAAARRYEIEFLPEEPAECA